MAVQVQNQPLRQRESGDVIVVHFTGCNVSLDEETTDGIRDQLLALANEPSESDLLFDFGNVDYLSSMMLATLISLHKMLLERGRQMTVANLTPHVHEVFRVTGLDKFLDLRSAEQDAGVASDNGQSSSYPGILIVDDETAVLRVLGARLHVEGFKVWLANSGRRAIELYGRHRDEIDLVLLDVQMPGMNGPHTLAELQSLNPSVPCFFMTGDPTPYTERTLMQMGALQVLQKPFAFTEVIDAFNHLTGRPPRCRRNRWIEIPWKGV
jgi:anti-anti-sigma factor